MVNIMKKALSTLLLMFVFGCATPYQEVGFGGGVSASVIDGKHVRISAKGNAFTDRAIIQEYALLRAAEETLALNKRYFAIVTSEDTTRYSQYTTPTQTQSTTSGTVTANTFGSTTFGNYSSNTNTTSYGGQTYNFVKPGTDVIIRTFAEGEIDPAQSSVFDARAIMEHLGAKYIKSRNK